jgi:hypothetical protein
VDALHVRTPFSILGNSPRSLLIAQSAPHDAGRLDFQELLGDKKITDEVSAENGFSSAEDNPRQSGVGPH